mgnify:CR=1 FL=1|tara:strand:- start:14692 stop:15801 length:1110 start_codon:yes stop_codon:yes gene_type:complete
MKVGVLTSSRADFGIYEALIDKLISDNSFELELIVFGTHLSKFHGFTINNIKEKYKVKIKQISSLLINDNEVSSATSYGLTVLKFADFWDSNTYDLVFCLGDRFEMSAAVQTGISFGVKFAHLHGGETTLGATDNIYRHQITLVSYLHFTSTDIYKRKVENLTGFKENIFNVGALSLSEFNDFSPVYKEDLFSSFNIKAAPFCLITFHPETNAFHENHKYAKEMKKALEVISDQINLVITMPNADTMGTVYRDQLILLSIEKKEQVVLVENFGKRNYFSAMYYAKFLLGNTSSGIIEAASFKKYVVNVGDRQKGRAQSSNIIDSEFNSTDIIKSVHKCIKLGEYIGENIYFKANSADTIVKIVKEYENI